MTRSATEPVDVLTNSPALTGSVAVASVPIVLCSVKLSVVRFSLSLLCVKVEKQLELNCLLRVVPLSPLSSAPSHLPRSREITHTGRQLIPFLHRAPALVSITFSWTLKPLAPSVPARVSRCPQSPFDPILTGRMHLRGHLTMKLSLLTEPPLKQNKPNLRVPSLRVMMPLHRVLQPTLA